jgi:hypothetical protein
MARNGNQTKELTPKQTRAISALLTAKDVGTAAREAGIGERTLYTWLDEPAFREELKLAERQAIEAVTRRLAGIATHALTVITNIMADETTPASVRLRAATTILDQMLKIRELADLEERIAALEALSGNQSQGG